MEACSRQRLTKQDHSIFRLNATFIVEREVSVKANGEMISTNSRACAVSNSLAAIVPLCRTELYEVEGYLNVRGVFIRGLVGSRHAGVS